MERNLNEIIRIKIEENKTNKNIIEKMLNVNNSIELIENDYYNNQTQENRIKELKAQLENVNYRLNDFKINSNLENHLIDLKAKLLHELSIINKSEIENLRSEIKEIEILLSGNTTPEYEKRLILFNKRNELNIKLSDLIDLNFYSKHITTKKAELNKLVSKLKTLTNNQFIIESLSNENILNDIYDYNNAINTLKQYINNLESEQQKPLYKIIGSRDILGCYSYAGYKYSKVEDRYYQFSDCFDSVNELREEFRIFKDAIIEEK